MFAYGVHEGRVGLSVQFSSNIEELVIGPIVANYPQCSLETTEVVEAIPAEWTTWSASLELVPEIYPILRHAQFEDLLNHNFADPLSGLLRVIKPSDEMQCRIEITVRPASSRRCHQMTRVVKRLDREFFRRHHRLARYYARHSTRPRGWFLACLLGLVALGTPEPTKTMLETSTSRLHEREDDLQVGSSCRTRNWRHCGIRRRRQYWRNRCRRRNSRSWKLRGNSTQEKSPERFLWVVCVFAMIDVRSGSGWKIGDDISTSSARRAWERRR